MTAPIKNDVLVSKVEASRRRLQELYRRAGDLPHREEALLQEALQELSEALEELYVAGEELRGQNDNLTATRVLVEAQRRHYQELFDFAPDGYIVTDTVGTIQEANHKAAELLQVSNDSLMGKPIIVFIAEQEHKAFRDLLVRLEQGGNARTWEMQMQPRAGAPFPAAITVSIIRQSQASGGRPIGLRWLVRDMTERKWAEEALRAARDELEKRVYERTFELTATNETLTAEVRERRRIEEKLRQSEARLSELAKQLERQLIASDRLVSVGELAASVAHEFNNPLQIILGFAQELLEETKPSEPHHESLTIIETETRRCREIIRNLLDFARPVETERAPSPVEPIVRNGVRLVFHYLQIAQIQVEIDIPPDLPPIYADSQQLQQVLMNLAFNAAEAMPKGGRLTIRAAKEPGSERRDGPGPELIIAVSDTGAGIPKENMTKIFRPFFSTKQKKGMGLGLSICERIVEAHGGRIIVESEPGTGTTFYLHFPLTEAKQYGRAS
jgi:PAS domain S-box-containing protein